MEATKEKAVLERDTERSHGVDPYSSLGLALRMRYTYSLLSISLSICVYEYSSINVRESLALDLAALA
jgi:hypothetical protein